MAENISGQHLSFEDYQDLMKVLKIRLPTGVLKKETVIRSREKDVVEDLQDIMKDLENFNLQFAGIPRLACREVKKALIPKKKSDTTELDIGKITKMIFFKRSKRSENALKLWESNKSKTVCGFMVRGLYQTKTISIPEMKETHKKGCFALEKNCATITKGTKVNMTELVPESSVSDTSSGISNTLRYTPNEIECLRFLQKNRLLTTDREGKSDEKISCTKGNKVEFGFLSGCLDFLAQIYDSTDKVIQKVIIECKNTKGDMVGKVFHKPDQGQQTELIKNHEYYFQTQAYRYILQNVESDSIPVQAMMVVRHKDKNEKLEYCWNRVEENTEQINKLRILCEDEALPRFLAVLNLIFQKVKEPERPKLKKGK